MWIDKIEIDHEGNTPDKNKCFFEVIKWDVKKKIVYRLDDFADLDISELQKYFTQKIEWVLIDIDDCIAPAYWQILEKNKQKIEDILDDWIKVWFLSNGLNWIERTKGLVEKWAVYCDTDKSKPSIEAFIEACNMIWVNPLNVIMFWDDISKDWWALQLDENWEQVLLWFVPVKPIWNSYKNIPNKKWLNYFFK